MSQHPSPLPYITCAVISESGHMFDEVIVPMEQRHAVLQKLYPFHPVPALTDRVTDLHTGKDFCVGEYRVFREAGFDILTSPWFPDGGGSVIDWIPLVDADDCEPVQVEEVRPGFEHNLIRLLELHDSF